jgi:hypothetical protein
MKRPSKRSVSQMRAKTAVRKTKPKAAVAANRSRAKPAKSSREKVRAYRERMRAKGLRLVQMWLPDTRTPEFAAEAHRQSLLANRSPSAREDQAWADAMVPLPQGQATTIDDIADLIGSVDGLPTDLASNKEKYLRAGYGRKRHR